MMPLNLTQPTLKKKKKKIQKAITDTLYIVSLITILKKEQSDVISI